MPRIVSRPLRCALVLALAPAPLLSQAVAPIPVGGCSAFPSGLPAGLSGPDAELARIAEVSGDAPTRSRLLLRHGETTSAVVRPQCGAAIDAGPLSVRIHPVEIAAVHNSGYVVDRDNGAMWSGRGASTAVRAGASLRWRAVTLTLAPELHYHANRAFATRPASLVDGSEHAHPFYRSIDLPQRYGDEAGWGIGAGQSALVVEGHGMTAGLSTENVWSGPAQRYPILLGNAAAGFPHLFVGTAGSPDVWVGRLNARLLWGRTEESDFFDDNPDNDWSNLFGWGLSLRPRGLAWLEVGALRVYHYRARSALDLDLGPVLGFLTPSDANRDGDELASLFLRAVLPESDAELYAEWARTDRFTNLTGDFIPEPDHSQGYMLGFQKLSPAGAGALRLMGELVHLQEKSEDRRIGAGRPLNVFYTNGQLRQGHTHLGQLLGAWVGPGADAQFIGLDYVWDGGGMAGAYVERVRRNETAGVAIRARDVDSAMHDVELIGGVRGRALVAGVTIAGELAWHERSNRDFLVDDSNLRAALSVAWWPRGAARASGFGAGGH